MRFTALSLLLCTACPPQPTVSPPDTSTEDSENLPVDVDADGYAVPSDCDDADASVHPDAPEVCDGIDQDCNDLIDDGILTDGEGCQDPGPPETSDMAQFVHVVARTDDGLFSGTGDGIQLCVSEGRCFPLTLADWTELESGAVDVFPFEGADLPRSEVTSLRIQTENGVDEWKPECLEVLLDGQAAYCRAGLDIGIGNGNDQTLSWEDELTVECETCFDATLTNGPVIGAASATSAQVWLRTSATQRTQLYVATEEASLTTAAPIATRYPLAENDFTTLLPVQGLVPQTTYHYAIEIDGERFGPWTFTTATDEPDIVRMAVGSCTKDLDQPIWSAISQYDPGVFLFIGDMHYGNTDDLPSYRSAWRQMQALPERIDFMAEHSTLFIWDDHDFTENNGEGTDGDRDAVLRGFHEYTANPTYGEEDNAGVYFQHRWGDVELFMLDVRYWRGVDGSILGAAQEQWLLDALEASDATFKVIASGTQFSAANVLGDTWTDYGDSRERLFQGLIDRNVEGVVLLSGDIHRSEFRLIETEGYDLPELTSSSLAYPITTPCLLGIGDEQKECYEGGHSFVGLEFDTTLVDPTLTATIIDEDGDEVASWEIHRAELEFATN